MAEAAEAAETAQAAETANGSALKSTRTPKAQRFRKRSRNAVVGALAAAAAGAAYGLLFGYAGATFASVQYSIFPLLWVLLGGAGTVLGPFIGTLFMFYLIDLSSELTTAYMLIAGLVLVALTLFAPQGLVGELRRRTLRWLP